VLLLVVLIVVAVVVAGGRRLVVRAGGVVLVSGELSGAVASVGGSLVLVVDGGRGGRRGHGVDGLHGLRKVVALHVEAVLVGRVGHRDGFALGVDVAVGADAAAVGGDALALLQTIVGRERVLERAVVSQRLLVAEDGRRWLLVLALVVLAVVVLAVVVVLACGNRSHGEDEDDALQNEKETVELAQFYWALIIFSQNLIKISLFLKFLIKNGSFIHSIVIPVKF